DGDLDRSDECRRVRRLLRSFAGPRLRHDGEPPPDVGERRCRHDDRWRADREEALRPRQPLDAFVRADSRATCRGDEDPPGYPVNLDPARTVFVILSFEGPDVYSRAGGLGVRVTGLSRALALMGYTTYLFFCGDPQLPGEEDLEGGKLRLRRWCQWISAQHRGGVYDGEE